MTPTEVHSQNDLQTCKARGILPGMDVLAAIRAAIRRGPDTPATIARRAGLPHSALTRLLAGKTMTFDGAARLADALGLELVIRPKRRRKG